MTIILLLVHYKGEKTQRMKDHRDNVTPYLDEFVNDDLAFLGMPAPNQCACTWQSGYIKCMWSTDRGSYMQRYISAAFRAIDVQCLPSRSISKIGLSIDGPSAKARYITAASVKHPSAAYTSYQKHSTSHTARSWELGKAPSAPKTFTIARVAASPMPCPSGSATSRIDDTASSWRTRTGLPPSTRLRYASPNPSSSTIPAGTSTLTSSRPSLRDEPPSKAASVPVSQASATIKLKARMKELNVGLNEHSQHDPPLPDTIPQAPTQAPSRPDVSSYPPPSLLSMPDMSSGSIGNVTRELWDVRREIAALAARETALEQQLKRLGSCPAPETPAATPLISTTGTPAPRDEISKLRAQLQAEDEARKVAERALEDERRRHELAEAAVADVRRECRAPFIVPALVDAFVQMSRIAGDVLAGAGGG